jgi:hypothetical protein
VLVKRVVQLTGAVCRSLRPLTMRISRQDLNFFIKKLEMSNPNDKMVLPDGREAQVLKQQYYQPRSETTLAASWRLVAIDGQSLCIKKVSRRKM